MKSILIWLLATFFLATPSPAQAQQPGKIPRIGYLATSTLEEARIAREAFQRGLLDLGYVEGKNINVEYRYADNNNERLPSLVAELVQLKVDEVFVVSLPAIRAAKQATKTIPIVMVTNFDPVAFGLVASMARPGGNLTGLTLLTRDLSGKRLELLKEIIPGLARIAVLWNAANPYSANVFDQTKLAGETLGIEVQSLRITSPNDLDGALEDALERE